MTKPFQTPPRTDHRLRQAATANADPAAAIAAAALIVAIADARDGRQEAVAWLTHGQGAHWAELLGARAALADVLQEVA